MFEMLGSILMIEMICDGFFTAMEIFLLDPDCKALYHAQNVGQSLEWSLCIVINDHCF